MFIYSEFIPVYFHSDLPGPPASGHTPGPVPSPQTPPAPDHPASVSGHTPETPETPVRSVRRTEARTWDEDSLCSPLTRAQRAQTRPGQSLPAGHTWATHSAAKSLSLGIRRSLALTDLNCPLFTGGYYKQSPEAGAGCPQSPRFNLREAGLRFLQRLSGLRQSVRRSKLTPLQEQARLPPAQGQFDDSDRVFFRGFSGADKLSEYESTRLRPQPTAPPRRKKAKLTRSFSLTYGDIVVKRVIICLKIKRKQINNDCFLF